MFCREIAIELFFARKCNFVSVHFLVISDISDVIIIVVIIVIIVVIVIVSKSTV